MKIINKFSKFPFDLSVVDPYITTNTAKELKVKCSKNIDFNETYDVILLLVAHKEFKRLTLEEWSKLVQSKSFYFDLKGIIPRELNPIRI